MLNFANEINWVLQALVVVIIIGVFYNLYATTKVYGGLIGAAIRYLGIGMLLVTVAVIEKVLFNFGIVRATANLSLYQDLLVLIGLFFLGVGFSKLASAAKP